jgi:hypothetical protein
MLSGNVISPIRRETVSAPDLACANSFASLIRNGLISSVRKSGETIAALDISAIDISAVELTRPDRRAPIRIDVMLTKRR